MVTKYTKDYESNNAALGYFWKTLDWGGKGGKGGAMRAHQKWLCTTPYFLVIADDQEG